MEGSRGAARRYARALLDLALQNGANLDAWLANVQALAEGTRDPRVAAFLGSPRVPTERKRALLEPIIAGLSPLERNFVHTLLARDRMDNIDSIADELRRMVYEHQGIVEVQARTAVELDDASRQQLTRRLAEMTGKKVLLSTSVDPALLGGIIVRIGDRLINGSVAGRLEALRQSLLSGT